MKKLHITEIFESDNARRFRLEYFPFFDLVAVRRAIVTPSYNPLYYKNIRFFKIPEKNSGTGADQIIIYTQDDKKAVRAEKSGIVVIENLTIREVRADGQ